MSSSFLLRLLACSLLLVLTATQAPAASRRGASSSAKAGEGGVDANFFYTNLADEGTWYNTTEYGDVWRPKVADQRPDWRPYTDGAWAQTEQGWTWISNESFGWATYHYGRWTDNVRGVGWAWVPGYEWAPAWVSFRTSDQQLLVAAVTEQSTAATERTASAADSTPPPSPQQASADRLAPFGLNPQIDPTPAAQKTPEMAVNEAYIGWAPLPPEAAWDPEGLGDSVDADYEIRPEDYCFVPVRYFGAPIVREVLWSPARNYYLVEHSYNVTRIAYGRDGRAIHVAGPDPAQVHALSERPIAHLTLQRQTNPQLAAAAIGAHRFNRVEGNRLIIAGPRVTAPTARTQIQRPPAIRAQVIPRGDRPTQAGVDSQTVQRVQQHVARQSQSPARSGGSAGGASNFTSGGVTSRSASLSGTTMARGSGGRVRGGGGNSSFDGGRVTRSGGGGGGRTRMMGGPRQQRTVFGPQTARFRAAPQQRASFAPAPSKRRR